MKTFNEFVSLSERPLTKGEEDKKEDIVKGMKKDKKGFEDRYGDDAKSVMYATATKLAKEETETVGGVTVLQDYDSTIQFREYEVIDIVKPEPMKGMASEQKELEPKEKPEPTVDQEPAREPAREPSKGNAELKKKEKKVNMMKRMILMKKMQAVRAGAGMDIVAHNEPEGEMIEGLVSMVKKGAKRHAKAIEKKKIKNRKAVPYAALGASYEPEGEVVSEGPSDVSDARTKAQYEGPGAPGLDAHNERIRKHKERRGKKKVKEEVELDERLAGKGYKRRKDYAGREVSGDWEDSDRGGGHKWQERVGKPVKKKSPTYLAHVHNKGKKKIDPEKNPVVEEKSKGRHPRDQKELDKAQEYIKKNPNFGKKNVKEAKVDKGRSDYGKASIRNYRRFGPGHGEPAMFDPENKRGKAIDKRREEHKERQGKKKAKVPAYKLGEEGYDRIKDKRAELGGHGPGDGDNPPTRKSNYHSRPDTPEQKKRKQAASDQAFKSVVDKLKKRYGDGVMTSSRKIRNGKEVK